MARKDNYISVHKCVFVEQAKKIKDAISNISEKDSLSIGDTQAIRKLTEVYEVLTSPVEEIHDSHPAVGSNDHHEAFQ